MSKCFVIQPFDGGKFDKRFADLYKPAIEAAGMTPYRVDEDPTVQVPIDSIEQGIRHAPVCFAEITLDKPNVWYELGYAFAARRPVVMVCSDERAGDKYPFDIQHRNILRYSNESQSDFTKFTGQLTERLKAALNRDESIEMMAAREITTPVQGLSQNEIRVLAVIAGGTSMPGSPLIVWRAKEDAERAGVTNMGFNLAIRKLSANGHVAIRDEYDDEREEKYSLLTVSEIGWSWIEKNESKFVLSRLEKRLEDSDDNIPF